MLEKIGIFVLFLAPLVFFHELGHFLFARLFGVRVEVFSLGFGPKILKFVKNHTQYAISLIPLGGYVKMFGDDPLAGSEISQDDRKHAFIYKSKWAKFWIVFGGPFANFIFAYFLFFSLLITGEKGPEAKFGSIKEDSYFSKLGVKTGDVLVGFNGQEIHGLTDLAMTNTTKTVETIKVLRKNIPIELKISKNPEEVIKEFLNLSPMLRRPLVVDREGNVWGISLSETNLDLNLSLEELNQEHLGQKIYLKKISYQPLTDEKANSAGELDHIKILSEPPIALEWNENKEEKSIFYFLNKNHYYPLDLVVKSLVLSSPADKIGIKRGDIIVGLNGRPVNSFEEIRDSLQKTPEGKEASVKVVRGNEVLSFKLLPEVSGSEENKVKTMGVFSSGDFVAMNFVVSKAHDPVSAMYFAGKRTMETIYKTLEGFKKLITNEVSIKSMGGPLAIGKVASDSFNISLSYFFKIMAFISINLGIINLFPIPVLDGGHIMFIILEIINRRPLSRRKLELAQQFGLSLLFILIFLALYNDISRLF